MYLRVYIVLLLTLFTLFDPISGKRSFGGGRASYPKSGGLSGGGGSRSGGHGYPSSGGLSGNSGSHGYPSSGGLSGGGHGYPSSGGSHGYPSSGGSHGYPSSGGSHGYPSSGGNHGYPSTGGNRGSGGSHAYPSSGGGLSGGQGRPNTANKPAVHHTTNVYNNYHYAPPAQISYASPHGGAPVNYPVYRGTPPTYVYQYKDSGSKYGTLLAGLALMNLGTLGVAAYAAHQANQNHGSGGSGTTYKTQPGEVCKFAIKKENGDYEETRIDCQIISSFILEDMRAQQAQHSNNSTITTTTVTNVTTIVNTTNVDSEHITTTTPPSVLYAMLPNGTLVPVNATLPQNNTAAAPNNTANPSSSVVITTTTTNTTQLVSALDVKGKPVDVTPGMKCFVIRNSPTSNMRKAVPCGLLQTYAEKSIQKNSAARNLPMFTIVAAVLAYCVA